MSPAKPDFFDLIHDAAVDLARGHVLNIDPDAHHAQSHTVASHSDTTATGAELETLTDGSETTLHSHAASGPTTLGKTADQTYSSDATYNNDTHLTWAGATNTHYKVHGAVKAISGSGANFKMTWSVPASATWTFAITGGSSNTLNWSDDGTSDFTIGPPTVDEAFILHFAGVIEVAGTGGSITLQHAQNTSQAVTTGLLDGSWLTYEMVS
jgi:hypothetical protein